MINTLTLLSLLKPTVVFAFNPKRLAYLLTVPVLALTGVLTLAYFFPIVSFAETAEVALNVNFYTLFAVAAAVVFLPVSLLRRTQEMIFFGGDTSSRVFWPKCDGIFMKCVATGIAAVLFSYVLSLFPLFVLLAVIRHFSIIPLPFGDASFVFGGAVFVCPYFCTRFVFKLSAVVAGRPLRWWSAWRLTRRIGIVLVVQAAVFLLLPLSVVALAYTATGFLIGGAAASLLFGCFGVAVSFLFATVLCSAYFGYVYSCAISEI